MEIQFRDDRIIIHGIDEFIKLIDNFLKIYPLELLTIISKILERKRYHLLNDMVSMICSFHSKGHSSENDLLSKSEPDPWKGLSFCYEHAKYSCICQKDKLDAPLTPILSEGDDSDDYWADVYLQYRKEVLQNFKYIHKEEISFESIPRYIPEGISSEDIPEDTLESQFLDSTMSLEEQFDSKMKRKISKFVVNNVETEFTKEDVFSYPEESMKFTTFMNIHEQKESDKSILVIISSYKYILKEIQNILTNLPINFFYVMTTGNIVKLRSIFDIKISTCISYHPSESFTRYMIEYEKCYENASFEHDGYLKEKFDEEELVEKLTSLSLEDSGELGSISGDTGVSPVSSVSPISSVSQESQEISLMKELHRRRAEQFGIPFYEINWSKMNSILNSNLGVGYEGLFQELDSYSEEGDFNFRSEEQRKEIDMEFEKYMIERRNIPENPEDSMDLEDYSGCKCLETY